MIISEKYKYIFIGIPFSASSATSKELLLNCGGKYILSKHSNIPLLIKKTQIHVDDYVVFAIYRDPLDALFTLYSKMCADQNNVWTDNKYLRSKGGHVSRKAWLLSKLVRKGLSFPSFVALKALFLPVDTFLTLNYPYLDRIIEYDQLSPEFNTLMNEIGIQRTTNIPLYNRTTKKGDKPKIPSYMTDYFIAPHLIYLKRQSIGNPIQLFGYFIFRITLPLRHRKWNRNDEKLINSDIHDSLNQKHQRFGL